MCLYLELHLVTGITIFIISPEQKLTIMFWLVSVQTEINKREDG